MWRKADSYFTGGSKWWIVRSARVVVIRRNMFRVVLAAACMLALVSARQDNLLLEGSADWEDTLDSLKGDLDDIDVGDSEGSGEEEEVVQMIPDKVEEEIEALDKDFHFKEKEDDPLYDYYHDVKEKDDYDYVEYDYDDDEYDEDYEEDEYDYPRGNKGGIDQESVLILDRTTQRPNIEIKPKKPLDKNNSLFETSHILIMAGSALVSFGLVMFAFFMCRRTMDNKKQKATAFVLPPPRTSKATAPIVKNYQRVPTTTKEFLQCRENTHIDMYRGDGVCEQKSAPPPAVYDPLLTKY